MDIIFDLLLIVMHLLYHSSPEMSPHFQMAQYFPENNKDYIVKIIIFDDSIESHAHLKLILSITTISQSCMSVYFKNIKKKANLSNDEEYIFIKLSVSIS